MNQQPELNHTGEIHVSGRHSASEPNRALRQRMDEFHKLRRDVAGRFTETESVLTQRLIRYREIQAETEATLELVRRRGPEIAALDSENWTEERLQSELGTAIRTLEHLRLELIGRTAKLAELKGAGIHADEKHHSSIIPELNSLTFRQLLRMGSAFSLPACLFILAGAALVAAAFMLAMRV